LLIVLDMSLFSGGWFVPAARAIPALLRGPLARQTPQFDEDRPGSLMPAAFSARALAPFGTPKWRRYRNKIKYLQ
jgi:hypothetical protein